MELYIVFNVVCAIILVLSILKRNKKSFQNGLVDNIINVLAIACFISAFFVRIEMDSPENIVMRGLRCCAESALLFYVLYLFSTCFGKEDCEIEQ